MPNLRDFNFQYFGSMVPKDLPCTDEELKELLAIDARVGQIIAAASGRLDDEHRRAGTY